jgi:hypothetical protein
MRKLATWLWLNALTPLRGDMPSFIRMNELPHIAPNSTSNSLPHFTTYLKPFNFIDFIGIKFFYSMRL